HGADSLAIYESSLAPWFKAHLLPDAASVPVTGERPGPCATAPGMSPSSGSPAPLRLLEVLGQLHLVQGRDDLFPQQLDGAHDVLMAHGPLIAVNVQVAGVQALDDLEQLAGHGLGSADNDVIDLLEL